MFEVYKQGSHEERMTFFDELAVYDVRVLPDAQEIYNSFDLLDERERVDADYEKSLYKYQYRFTSTTVAGRKRVTRRSPHIGDYVLGPYALRGRGMEHAMDGFETFFVHFIAQGLLSQSDVVQVLVEKVHISHGDKEPGLCERLFCYFQHPEATETAVIVYFNEWVDQMKGFTLMKGADEPKQVQFMKEERDGGSMMSLVVYKTFPHMAYHFGLTSSPDLSMEDVAWEMMGSEKWDALARKYEELLSAPGQPEHVWILSEMGGTDWEADHWSKLSARLTGGPAD